MCGKKVYVIVDSSDVPVPWMLITGSGPYTITSKPIMESLIGSTLNYKLKITFADAKYPDPVKRMDIPVIITAATCNCNLLLWDNPAITTAAVEVALGPLSVTIPTATQNAVSKTTTPEIRKCFENSGTCPFTSTWAPTSLPAFVTQNA